MKIRISILLILVSFLSIILAIPAPVEGTWVDLPGIFADGYLGFGCACPFDNNPECGCRVWIPMI